MGDKHRLMERCAANLGAYRNRCSADPLERGQIVPAKGEGNEARAHRGHVQAELACDPVSEIGGAEPLKREPAGGNYQSIAGEVAERG